MAQTENFNLKLISQGEHVTIDDINSNMEIIDSELGNGLALSRQSVEINPGDFQINADTLDGRTSDYYLDYIVEHVKAGTVHQLTNPSNKSGVYLAIFIPTASYEFGEKFSINETIYTTTDLLGQELTPSSISMGVAALAIVDTINKKLTIVSSGASGGTGGNINYTAGNQDLIDGTTPLAAGTFHFVY